jgi:GAF domain-containing protein
MVSDDFLHSLLDIYGELGRQVASQTDVSGAFLAVTTVAARSVPGVDVASITRRRPGGFDTVGSTNDAAIRADALQYEFGNGPCVDAVVKESVFRSHDLATDPRWPKFGPAAAEAVGVRSVLSIRLALDDADAMAGLNLYSYQRGAFDVRAQDVAMLLATHAGVIVSRQLVREKATQLETALTTNREIGLAMGVLMSSHKITRDEAFTMLRIASQRSNRKVRDIATEVADTGTLDLS